MTLYFTEEHEYIRIEDGVGIVGISNYAQNALGDVVYVELPKVGAKLEKGAQAGVVESVKSASEIYSPVTGEVVEINAALEGAPQQVNADPMKEGWFYKIKIANVSELKALKDEAAYTAYTKVLG